MFSETDKIYLALPKPITLSMHTATHDIEWFGRSFLPKKA